MYNILRPCILSEKEIKMLNPFHDEIYCHIALAEM